MTDKPILFSGPMVRALLAGTKNLRRVCLPKGSDTMNPHHLARRLASKLDSAVDGECWNWTGAHNGSGYGTMVVMHKTVYAHRLAYELSTGQSIPRNLDVMHDCDNPRCINPAHLALGTRSKNMTDCHARGRSKIPSVRKFGESNGSAKITADIVASIRARLSQGESQRVIAEDFGISQSHVSGIKRQKVWAEDRINLEDSKP